MTFKRACNNIWAYVRFYYPSQIFRSLEIKVLGSLARSFGTIFRPHISARPVFRYSCNSHFMSSVSGCTFGMTTASCKSSFLYFLCLCLWCWIHIFSTESAGGSVDYFFCTIFLQPSQQFDIGSPCHNQ